MSGKVLSQQSGASAICRALLDGTALSKFRQMIVKQGVEQVNADDLCGGKEESVLPRAKYQTTLYAEKAGYSFLSF